MKTNVISIHYTLKDKTGNVLDSSRSADPLSYLEGVGQIIPGLESQLKGLVAGDKKNVVVKAAEAYGDHDENLVIIVERSQFGDSASLNKGDQFQVQSPDGMTSVFTVMDLVGADKVKLDGNHPLAGQDLYFDIEMMEVREATAEELEHGHAHGAGDHHHH